MAGDQEPVVKSPTNARSAEPGPSILVVLVVSMVATIVLFAAVWMLFFRS